MVICLLPSQFHVGSREIRRSTKERHLDHAKSTSGNSHSEDKPTGNSNENVSQLEYRGQKLNQRPQAFREILDDLLSEKKQSLIANNYLHSTKS